MDNPKLILAFFLGACFLGFSVLFLSPPKAYWTEVGEARQQVLELEMALEKLGYQQYEDFMATIEYKGASKWEGYMTNFVPFDYHLKFWGNTPLEVYEEMRQELLTNQKLN